MGSLRRDGENHDCPSRTNSLREAQSTSVKHSSMRALHPIKKGTQGWKNETRQGDKDHGDR